MSDSADSTDPTPLHTFDLTLRGGYRGDLSTSIRSRVRRLTLSKAHLTPDQWLQTLRDARVDYPSFDTLVLDECNAHKVTMGSLVRGTDHIDTVQIESLEMYHGWFGPACRLADCAITGAQKTRACSSERALFCEWQAGAVEDGHTYDTDSLQATYLGLMLLSSIIVSRCAGALWCFCRRNRKASQVSGVQQPTLARAMPT